MKGNAYWSGTYYVDYENKEAIDKASVEFTARGTYYYSPGSMYRNNGDPGDPPEEDIDVKSIDITCIRDEEGNDITDSYTEEQIKSIKDDIISEIECGEYQDYMEVCDE